MIRRRDIMSSAELPFVKGLKVRLTTNIPQPTKLITFNIAMDIYLESPASKTQELSISNIGDVLAFTNATVSEVVKVADSLYYIQLTADNNSTIESIIITVKPNTLYIYDANNRLMYPNGFNAWTQLTINTDYKAPLLSAFTPTLDEQVAGNSNLTMTFNEVVSKGTASLIQIRRQTTNELIRSIDISSGDVTIGGEGENLNKIVTISGNNLPSASAFYVTIGTACFKDASGNFYAGLTDVNTWKFSTTIGAPTAAVTNLARVQKTRNSTRLSFTRPADANNVLIIGIQGANTISNTEGSNLFTTNAAFNDDVAYTYTGLSYTGSNQSVTIGGNTWKVLYKGTATDVNITGLTTNTMYSYYVIPYNELSGATKYYRGLNMATIQEQTNRF